MSKSLKTYLLSIAPTRLGWGIELFLRNLKGAIVGGIIGFFFSKQYEAGALLQREMSRAFSILGMEQDVFLRMILFILAFAFIGAILEHKLIRGR